MQQSPPTCHALYILHFLLFLGSVMSCKAGDKLQECFARFYPQFTVLMESLHQSVGTEDSWCVRDKDLHQHALTTANETESKIQEILSQQEDNRK